MVEITTRQIYDKVEKLAEQHGELDKSLAGIKGEVGIIKWVAVGIFLPVLMAAAKYLFLA